MGPHDALGQLKMKSSISAGLLAYSINEKIILHMIIMLCSSTINIKF